MKGKILFPLALFSIFINSYSQEYFEGEVHFKISYDSFIDQLPEALLIQEFGDTLVGYVQENRYIMTSNTKGTAGEQKLIMLMDENLVYVVSEKSDTIYRSPINKEEDELIEVHKVKDETKVVLGDICPAVILNSKNTDPENPFTVKLGKYFYNPKFKLNKAAYANHKSGHWNSFVNETGAISVRNEVRHEPLYKSVMVAFQILPKKIPDALFDITKYNKVIIDLE